jgi:hypothetical protein
MDMFESYTNAEIAQAIREGGGEVPETGSGANGNVVRADLLDALNALSSLDVEPETVAEPVDVEDAPSLDEIPVSRAVAPALEEAPAGTAWRTSPASSASRPAGSRGRRTN